MLTILLSLSLWAQEGVVNSDIFQEGARFTWSYSEKTDGKWDAPYAYETYEVVGRKGDIATIAMSTSPELEKFTKPHHLFVVNLKKCQIAGKSMLRFSRFKISFYRWNAQRRARGGWELLTHRHKPLAFTEKFNCYHGKIRKRFQTLKGSLNTLDVFQFAGLPIRSWYLADGPFLGVAAIRETKNYKMLLEKIEIIREGMGGV